jgi:archaellum component FlaD/FlaE
MELDKRVNEIETELKIMKGEIKELLVDIRDLVNKNENPFCSIPSLEALKFGAPEKEECADKQPDVNCNGESGLKPAEEISESENQNIKNSENSQKLTSPCQENPVQNVQKQEMNRPEPESLRKIDTFMLVELMRWVDYAVRTIGHSNLKELLNLYALTGQLPEETRRIIENIANLSIEEPAEEERVSMKDNIMVLSQLSAIMNPEGFRKNIQPLYETSPGWKDKEKEKKAGLVSIEFEARKELRD